MFSFRSINSSKYQQTLQNQSSNNTQTPPTLQNNITFSLSYRKQPIQLNTPSTTITSTTPELNKLNAPKLKWGEPTWNLFHVISEKIIPEFFFNMRTELFDIIRNICYNLPCPDCANHARNYINAVNFNSITTPSHLKELFYNFHNTVNERKKFPIFERTELEKRYQPMNLINVFLVFLKHFRDKHKSTRMIADDLYRNKLANKIEKWFMENINKFAL